MTAINDKKIRAKTMKEKTLERKKLFELIKQNIYEQNKSTSPEALISTKKSNQGRSDTKKGTIRNKAEKLNTSITDRADTAVLQT